MAILQTSPEDNANNDAPPDNVDHDATDNDNGQERSVFPADVAEDTTNPRGVHHVADTATTTGHVDAPTKNQLTNSAH